MPRDRRPPPPLDTAALERLALRYVERFATTRGKLRDYLARKVRERGWDDDRPADGAALAERMAELGYIDDRGFAQARVGALGRRGYGARRIDGALRAAGVVGDDAAAMQPVIDGQADASAIAFARRRRIGPFARGAVERPEQQRALAAMLRAGHDFDRARRIMAMTPDDVDRFDADNDDRAGN
ncbi:MAG: RecX family transcriptional regulator [Pseudomonadota bacterium]